jgi:hypothetical protein
MFSAFDLKELSHCRQALVAPTSPTETAGSVPYLQKSVKIYFFNIHGNIVLSCTFVCCLFRQISVQVYHIPRELYRCLYSSVSLVAALDFERVRGTGN